MIRYLITDGSATRDESRWLKYVAEWMERGVELVQVRERDMEPGALARLVRKVLALPNPHGTKVLVNDRIDVAIACGADGVHLREGSIAPEQVRAGAGAETLIVSAVCHAPGNVPQLQGADYIIAAPVFAPLSKEDSRAPLGLEGLTAAARLSQVPVLALGGVTPDNERFCTAAGAAGIAGISYFL